MIFDEDGFACATTERFDADCSGAGEEIEETRIGNAVGENVKQGFAQTIAGGAQSVAFEGLELTTTKCSGDDAHGIESTSTDVSQMIAALPLDG